MRNEAKFKRFSIEIIADPNFPWFALENTYRFSCRASAYFAYSQGFVFQGKFKLYLGFFEEGNTSDSRIYFMKVDVEHVSSHAVPLGTILSLTAKPVW